MSSRILCFWKHYFSSFHSFVGIRDTSFFSSVTCVYPIVSSCCAHNSVRLYVYVFIRIYGSIEAPQFSVTFWKDAYTKSLNVNNNKTNVCKKQMETTTMATPTEPKTKYINGLHTRIAYYGNLEEQSTAVQWIHTQWSIICEISRYSNCNIFDLVAAAASALVIVSRMEPRRDTHAEKIHVEMLSHRVEKM